MDALERLTGRFAPRFLRFSLAIVLLWIGALKFVDPSPVVGLLDASLSFLAFPAFVYLLGVLEVSAAVLLFAGIGLRYVGLLVAGLFTGTLVIFLIAPAVSYGDAGFPKLSLAGEFLLKDLVLMAAALTITAMAATAERSAPAR
jgi:putative oxidoreductase